MSKESRKFKVPDELANLYDFANSLDVRHFTHHGLRHVQGDELTVPRDLAAWMLERGLLAEGVRITPAMLDTARQLRITFAPTWRAIRLNDAKTRMPFDH